MSTNPEGASGELSRESNGSFVGLRPEYQNHVWSYDFVHHRTDDGRGLRTPDAECSIILCDPRIDRFTKIAPTRFQKTYFEGMAISVDATKSERSLQLRKDALAHYGETCSTETEA